MIGMAMGCVLGEMGCVRGTLAQGYNGRFNRL